MVWLLYLTLQLLIDTVIYFGRPIWPLFEYYLVNFIPALIFLGLSFTAWVRNQSRSAMVVMILLISLVPVVLPAMFNLRLPEAPLANVEGMVMRQLPILLIGVVLVAWRYSIDVLLGYLGVVYLLELGIVIFSHSLIRNQMHAYLFTTLIRTVSFFLMGAFINQLVSVMHTQQQSLAAANRKLANYTTALEELTISRERNRVSRELHDTVVHSLSGLSVQLETIKAYLGRDKEIANTLVDQALASTRSGLSETRRALKELRASPLEDLGLIEAVRTMAYAAAQRGSLELDLNLPDQEMCLAPNIEQSIYRIIQEAVENVVHHANANKLTIRLRVLEKDLEVLVQDDGIGFDATQTKVEGHYGLSGMRERAQVAGGQLDLNSQPNNGTSITVTFKGCVE
jgi:signal transduction histidine kinase